MRSSRLLVLAVAMSVGLFVFPLAAGGAAPDFVEVCHLDVDGDTETSEWSLIELPDRAVARHVAHGDFFPGDPVPGQDDYFFSSECVPQPDYYALAYTDIDPADGDAYNPSIDVLISKLVDGPGDAADGILGPGDLIIHDKYPRDLAASTFGEFGVKELVANYTVSSVNDPESPDFCFVAGLLFPDTEGDPIHSFTWQRFEGGSESYALNDASQSNRLAFVALDADVDIVLRNPFPNPAEPEDESLSDIDEQALGDDAFVDIDILGCDF